MFQNLVRNIKLNHTVCLVTESHVLYVRKKGVKSPCLGKIKRHSFFDRNELVSDTKVSFLYLQSRKYSFITVAHTCTRQVNLGQQNFFIY